MKKLSQFVTRMNFKKAVLTFIITALIAIAGFSAALYGNFHSKVNRWESSVKTESEYRAGENRAGRRGKHGLVNSQTGNEKTDIEKSDEEPDYGVEEMWDQNFSTGDKALVIIAGIAACALAVWYWVLCMMWAYRKATRLGINGAVWVWVTLFFNLLAIAVLYLYGAFRGTCYECGRIRTKGQNYCDRCGAPFTKECPNCGQEVDIRADYCPNCGNSFVEEQAGDQPAGSSGEV